MTRRNPPKFVSNGTCVCYVRISKLLYNSDGNGLMAQSSRVIREAKKLQLTFRDDIHHDSAAPPRGGFFVDAGHSAFDKSTLQRRPAGAALLANLRRGDTLLVAKVDRLCRNVVNFIEIANEMVDRGVRLVICDPSMNLGTSTGQMLARFLALVAEWESSRKGERIREALSIKKSQGVQKRRKTACACKTVVSSDYSSETPDIEDLEVLESKSSSPAGEYGRITIYTRCSHRDSVISGLGLLKQAEIARAYGESLIEANSSLVFGRDFVDPAVSASKVDLRNREAGRFLDHYLKRGDHVVFSSLDRGFRSAQDMANTIPEWMDRGVHIHFVNEGLSMDDPGGKLFASIVVQFAELEAQMTSDRTREARAIQNSKGKYAGGCDLPCFFRINVVAGQKYLVIDRKQVLAFRCVLFLRHHRKLTVRDACHRTEELFAKRENRPVICQTGAARFSKTSNALPKDYPRGSTGIAFPVVTSGRWQWMRPRWPEALKAWRRYAQQVREKKRQR